MNYMLTSWRIGFSAFMIKRFVTGPASRLRPVMDPKLPRRPSGAGRPLSFFASP